VRFIINAGALPFPAMQSGVKMEWQPIKIAPFDRELELAVMEAGEVHALVFPCRRVVGGWSNSGTNERLQVHPTHWRPWIESQ
jgi:hypothetical protein